jgi:CHASE3 domain sensor protein
MKGLMKGTVLILFLIVCIQAVSASMTVESVTIDPSGSLTPGTPATVQFKIDAGSFPSGGEIRLFTDLDNPKWTYTVIVNGVENIRPVEGGRTLAISGFELSYKPSDEVSVRTTLEGVAPTVTQTSNKTMIRITSFDSNGKPETSSQVEKTALVINTGEVASTIASADAELQVYRTHIDEKAALGIDTALAEVKYNEAQGKIDSARARPSNQYAGAQADLTTATAAIKDGETALDKAWAEFEVAAAQVPITNVDAIIAWFKGNSSTANDQQLPTIVTKREVAVSYVSTANDDIADGSFAQARQKAQDAFLKANESYTEALARQKELSSGFSLPIPKFNSTMFIILGVVAVILVVVGVIIYRKRSRWDELG